MKLPANGFIRNPVSYHDRTVQRWHAEEYGDTTTTAIDVDLMGYCRSCNAPLYIIEASSRSNKPTSVIQSLARRAGVPACLVVHTDRITEWRRVGGSDPTSIGGGWNAPETLGAYLDGLRRFHRESHENA